MRAQKLSAGRVSAEPAVGSTVTRWEPEGTGAERSHHLLHPGAGPGKRRGGSWLLAALCPYPWVAASPMNSESGQDPVVQFTLVV